MKPGKQILNLWTNYPLVVGSSPTGPTSNKYISNSYTITPLYGE